MVAIKQQFVSQNVISKRTHGYGNPCRFITIHQTGNTSKGANAQAHANIQSRLNPRQASWHYQVDDKEIIQSFDDKVKCWHATDGNGPGNTTSIAIEICINSDGDYKKAVQNAAKLTKHLLNKHNLGIDKVKQHRDWYAKDCPAQLRAGYKGITWNDFIKMVKGEEVKVDAPKTEVGSVKVESPKKPSGVYTGDSIVDYLNSIGVDSSKENRKKLAKQYDVKGYDFSASKNLELLNKMRSGKPVSKPAAKPKPQPKGTVHLPASAKTWRTYKLNVKPVKKNSDWSLTPAAFGGLTYKILGRPYPNVVTIMTGRGKRNIYVGPETGAVIK